MDSEQFNLKLFPILVLFVFERSTNHENNIIQRMEAARSRLLFRRKENIVWFIMAENTARDVFLKLGFSIYLFLALMERVYLFFGFYPFFIQVIKKTKKCQAWLRKAWQGIGHE